MTDEDPSAPSTTDEILARRFVFHCRQAGVRIPDDERLALDVDVFHWSTVGCDTPPDWAPRSLRQLYGLTDGVWLFCPSRVGQEPTGTDYGFIIYPVGDVERETTQVREWALSDLAYVEDELTSAELDSVRLRIAQLVVIGTSVGGDPITLDPTLQKGANEAPVVMLNHEMLVANLFETETDDEEGPTIWSGMADFLIKADQDPAASLGDHWRFVDADGEQFYVESADAVDGL